MTVNEETAIHAKTLRILVIDDEEFNRRLLSRIVGHYGEIIEAADGRTGLQYLAEESFDLVLLDIMMPEMNGIEVLMQIRQQATSNALPVILISALNDNGDIVKGLEAGANDYITKPIDMDLVQARVRTQLRLKSVYDLEKTAVAKLEKADALKTKLLSIASHDLKSPLSNVKMAEVLLRNLMDSDDSTIVKILDTLKMTVDNMNNLIVEFLDMAQLQSHIIEVEIEPVSLRGIVDDVIDAQRLYMQEKDSQILDAFTDVVAYADRTRLAQVLNNLVSNALKYSPPNAEIQIRVIESENYVVIEVVDEGPGIPEREQHKLFTEFGKLSTRPTSNESSTGLGLWIARQMTELMNGEIGVYCPDTGGSVFWVELPTSSVILESAS